MTSPKTFSAQGAKLPKTVPFPEDFLPSTNTDRTIRQMSDGIQAPTNLIANCELRIANCFDSPQLTSKEILQAWISEFVYSFAPGKFRDILEISDFSRQQVGVWQAESMKVFCGLTVVITCECWKNYRQLVARTKQLTKRVKKIDPSVEMLMLLSPDCKQLGVTVLATGERFAIANQHGRPLIEPPSREY